MPPNDSPFWPLARQISIATVLCGFGLFAFYNGMSLTDGMQIVTLMGLVFGIDFMHSKAPDSKGP